MAELKTAEEVLDHTFETEKSFQDYTDHVRLVIVSAMKEYAWQALLARRTRISEEAYGCDNDPKIEAYILETDIEQFIK